MKLPPVNRQQKIWYYVFMRSYCFCPPTDGKLYVELPSQNQLLTFLLQQQWKKRANFRTLHGYVPYFGAGVGFDFLALYLKGVRPSWYLTGDYATAVEELVEDGIFESYSSAELHFSTYPSECEWQAPAGFRFSFEDIDHIWISHNVGEPLSSEEIIDYLHEILPPHVTVLDEAPAPMGNLNPCKNRLGQLGS